MLFMMNIFFFFFKVNVNEYRAMFVNECGGPLLCSTGLPLMVLLLYWAELPLAVLGPSVLNKGVETDLIRTQLSPTCA